jgi:Family of unknown function (DUF5677)
MTRFYGSEASFRAYVRSRPESKSWFDLADDLARQGIDLLGQHSAPIAEPQHFTFSGVFVRAHQSFQAATLLVENGMIGDARTAIRSAAESGIALHALAVDPTFVDQLVKAHERRQRIVANVTLQNPEYKRQYSAEDISKMEALVADPTKIPDLKWEQVAARHCPDLYQLVYRYASTDVHVTADSIERYFIYDANGRIQSLNVAPNTGGLVDTLRLACIAMVWVLEAYDRMYQTPGLKDELQGFLRRFASLPATEIVGRNAASSSNRRSVLLAIGVVVLLAAGALIGLRWWSLKT